MSRIGAIKRWIESWFITQSEESREWDRVEAVRHIKWTAEHEVYEDSRGRKDRNKPEYTNVDNDEVIRFKRFSGVSDYADFYWVSFKEPKEAISLLDHVLSKGPEMGEIVKLVDFITHKTATGRARLYSPGAEVDRCDLVAVRGGEPPVIVELKKIALSLVYQGIERQRIKDAVYLAVTAPNGRKVWARNRKRGPCYSSVVGSG